MELRALAACDIRFFKLHTWQQIMVLSVMQNSSNKYYKDFCVYFEELWKVGKPTVLIKLHENFHNWMSSSIKVFLLNTHIQYTVVCVASLLFFSYKCPNPFRMWADQSLIQKQMMCHSTVYRQCLCVYVCVYFVDGLLYPLYPTLRGLHDKHRLYWKCL